MNSIWPDLIVAKTTKESLVWNWTELVSLLNFKMLLKQLNRLLKKKKTHKKVLHGNLFFTVVYIIKQGNTD